ncbi:MAG TPA: rRNA maturation RNase YbeY [Anaerolineales bacterium]|nr:rRNA maturation RNase YbeY [Anaerolineales bacterium]
MIHIRSSTRPSPVASRLLQRAARAALANQSMDGDLSIVLTDDARLRQLNREYLGIDAPTDVLSFPASETDPESGGSYLGDILISVPRARQQAGAAGHPLASEVQLLVVHGVLHLLGHDHATSEERSRMWAAQSAILASLGLADIHLTES